MKKHQNLTVGHLVTHCNLGEHLFIKELHETAFTSSREIGTMTIKTALLINLDYLVHELAYNERNFNVEGFDEVAIVREVRNWRW